MTRTPNELRFRLDELLDARTDRVEPLFAVVQEVLRAEQKHPKGNGEIVIIKKAPKRHVLPVLAGTIIAIIVPASVFSSQ